MTPRCDDIQARLSDRLLGEADFETDAALAAHLQECADCRGFLDEIVWQDLALSEEAARTEIPEILRRWRGLPAPRRHTLRRPRAASPFPFIAAAGLLLVALGLAVGRATAPRTPSRPAPIPAESDLRADQARAAEQRRSAEERLLEIERRREKLRMAVEAAERERQEAERQRALDELARMARERYQAEAALEEARGNAERAEMEVLKTPAPPAARPGTVVAAAALEGVAGDVRLGGGARAEQGRWLLPGQSLETKGDGSFALLRFADGTRVRIDPRSRVTDVSSSGGKRVALAEGSLRAEVAPQPAGAPMVFATPHGEARVLGTSLRLAVDPRGSGGASLEVLTGRVLLTSPDGRSAEVSSGQAAVAALGRAPAARPIGEITLHFQDGMFPDPFYEGTRDTALREHDPAVPGGARLHLEPDGNEPSGTEHDVTALLRWDLSAIPPGSRVISASLHVRTIDSSDDVYSVAEMRRPWVEAEATWLSPSAGAAWQSPGAAGPLDRGTKVLATMGPMPSKGDLSVLLNDEGLRVVQGWIDRPATNHGLIVHGSSNSDGLGFYSREYKHASQRPRLSVTFAPSR